MLADVNVGFKDDFLKAVCAIIGNGDADAKKVDTGVYEISHFSFNSMIKEQIKDKYPKCEEEDFYAAYGVCDNYKQILKKFT